jgi:hypothetical protein
MIRRGLKTAAIAVCAAAGLFVCSSAKAAENYSGWPCYVGYECTLHRAAGLTLPVGNVGFLLRVHDQNGNYTQSDCSGYDPDDLGTFHFTFAAATSGVVQQDLIRFQYNDCQSGGSLWESVTGTVRILDAGEPPGEEGEAIQNDLEGVLPSFGWGFSTSSGNGTATTTMQDHLNASLGATTNTFPVCLSYGWTGFVDTIIGITDGTASPQTMRFSQTLGGQTNELEIDLARTTVTSDPHFLSIVSKVQAYALALGWLSFGIYVFTVLFLKHEEQQ